MHRSILPAIAGCFLLSSATFAQINAAPPAAPAPAPAADILPDRADALGFIEFQTADEFLATDLLGRGVVNPAEENLGAINNLIVSAEGTLTGVIVGVGGFLGIGVKDVAIAWDALTLGTIEGELRIVLNADRAALDAAPDFQTLAELGIERLTVDVAPPAPAAVPPAAPEAAPAPAPPAAVEPAPAPAPAPAEPAPAPTPAPAPQPAPPAPVTPIGGPEVPVAPGPVEPAPAAAAPVTPTFMAAQDPTAILTAELIGRPVFNLQDESLGTVNNILFSSEGEIVALVVGVGGFLGMGAKDVAIAFEAVRTTVVDGELRLVFDATRDTLGAAPAFQRLPD